MQQFWLQCHMYDSNDRNKHSCVNCTTWSCQDNIVSSLQNSVTFHGCSKFRNMPNSPDCQKPCWWCISTYVECMVAFTYFYLTFQGKWYDEWSSTYLFVDFEWEKRSDTLLLTRLKFATPFIFSSLSKASIFVGSWQLIFRFFLRSHCGRFKTTENNWQIIQLSSVV